MVLSKTMLHRLVSSVFKVWRETSRGFEPRSLDSESRVLTVTTRENFWFGVLPLEVHFGFGAIRRGRTF